MSDAQDWVIHDIRIGGRSRLAVSGGVPGDVFMTNEINRVLSLSPIEVWMDVVLDVTYVGNNLEGRPFVCGLLMRFN